MSLYYLFYNLSLVFFNKREPIPITIQHLLDDKH